MSKPSHEFFVRAKVTPATKLLCGDCTWRSIPREQGGQVFCTLLLNLFMDASEDFPEGTLGVDQRLNRDAKGRLKRCAMCRRMGARKAAQTPSP